MILDRLASELEDLAQIEQRPNLEGRNMTMVLGPSKAVLKGDFDDKPAGDEPVADGEVGAGRGRRGARDRRTGDGRPRPPPRPRRSPTRAPPPRPRRPPRPKHPLRRRPTADAEAPRRRSGLAERPPRSPRARSGAPGVQPSSRRAFALSAPRRLTAPSAIGPATSFASQSGTCRGAFVPEDRREPGHPLALRAPARRR